MRKILLLGGSAQQVIAIETAKQLGLVTVLCDYLPDNPGRKFADRFYMVSTTDKDAILNIAKSESIDGILAYASDPAAPTAAYVADKLGLPGNPYESVDILCNKDKYREFLRDNGFNTPKAKGYSTIIHAVDDLKAGKFKFPVIVKPVDSSGSKGVSKIESEKDASEKIEYALSYSRVKRIILEEYVEEFGYQIAGDGLSINGTLVFRYFANDHFDSKGVNPFVPIAASFPCCMSNEVQGKVHAEIQRLISLLKMKTCTYNFDIRIDKHSNIYLMEVAPRDGGNYIPDIIRYATGVDLVDCSVKAAMGDSIELEVKEPKEYYAYYAVHSYNEGLLDSIQLAPNVSDMILDNHIIYKTGDRIKCFTGANTTLGCYVMKFESMEQMLYMLDNSEEWIKVLLKE